MSFSSLPTPLVFTPRHVFTSVGGYIIKLDLLESSRIVYNGQPPCFDEHHATFITNKVRTTSIERKIAESPVSLSEISKRYRYDSMINVIVKFEVGEITTFPMFREPTEEIGCGIDVYDTEETAFSINIMDDCPNYTGTIKTWYNDGSPNIIAADLVNGKRVGIWEQNLLTRRIKGGFLNDKRQGMWCEFSPTDELILEEFYDQDELNGVQRIYYENNHHLKTENRYKNGKLHGRCQDLSVDGRPIKILNFQDNELHGIYTEFGDTGACSLYGRYYKGKKHGKWFVVADSGEKFCENWNHGTKCDSHREEWCFHV